ncbi:MAG: hypothetical protein HY820_15455 [Acidobacteria bacterium]|nr:hypothetical protein [Acidobacteriota bacterium]
MGPFGQRRVAPGGRERRIAIVGLGNSSRPVVHRYIDRVVAAVNAANCGSNAASSWPVDQLAGNWFDWTFCPAEDELFSILGPRPLRDVYHYDCELRKQL